MKSVKHSITGCSIKFHFERIMRKWIIINAAVAEWKRYRIEIGKLQVSELTGFPENGDRRLTASGTEIGHFPLRKRKCFQVADKARIDTRMNRYKTSETGLVISEFRRKPGMIFQLFQEKISAVVFPAWIFIANTVPV